MGKGKLFGLLAVFAAISLVTASGAFTTVSAERTATVNVAGDESALLALEPAPGSNGDEYARIEGGELELNLAGYNSSATGVNPNAVTDFDSVFVITNQGTQEVAVNITDSGDYNDSVTFYNGSVSTGPLESGSETLSPGDSVVVSIKVDTTGVSGEHDLITEITISAEATN
jgi:hypothetical protein